MVYRVELTSAAEADAYVAFERIQSVAPTVAARWLQGLFEAIATLNSMPQRCPIIAESEELGEEFRQLLYGHRSSRYRIVFDVQENVIGGARVRVLRIWHGARDRLEAEDLLLPEE